MKKCADIWPYFGNIICNRPATRGG